ncbi:MAG TPA: DUF58 domain-containing protein [Streptosporangiaceae bacterium]
MKHPARWLPSRGTRRLATVGLLALAAALISGHAALMLLAAPVLAALAAAPRGGGAAEVEVGGAVSAARCFEREEVGFTVTVTAAEPLEEIAFLIDLPAQIELVSGQVRQVAVDTAHGEAHWVVRPVAWGRRPLGQVRIVCRSHSGAWETSLDARASVVEVFPRPPSVQARLVPPDLLRRIGEHTSRATGDGIEFSAVRPYLPGDRIRDVNWLVTGRRGELHINQRATQRAADLVVMIDAFSEAGPPGATTIDTSAHGATALATAYLRTGDRAGLVVLGGMLRWLGPAPGERHFYQIAEMLLRVRYESEVVPDLDRIPRTALPPGALVILFSPLLDKRVFGAIADLRERGFSLVVIDVLNSEPEVLARSRSSELALRLWRLDRTALRSSLAGNGIPIVSWDGDADLDAAMSPVRRVPASTGRRS